MQGMMNNDAFSVLFGGQESRATNSQKITSKAHTPITEQPQVSSKKIELQNPAPKTKIPTIEKSQTTAENIEIQKSTSQVIFPPITQNTKSGDKKNKKSDFFPRFSLGEKIKNFLKETKAMIIIFLSILCVFYFFTNAQLVFYTFKDAFSSVNAAELHQISETLIHNAAENEKESNLKQIEKRFAQIQEENTTGSILALWMEELAEGNAQDLNYNILPPTNRLIIPDLNINVPLVNTESNGRVDFSQENFDDELTKGVVKYPTTPTPWSKGNTLIFGHTSTEWWKKNEYGVVFRNIPKLKAGQRFQVVWNGQLTTYEMVERKVVLPKHVEDYYHEFSDKGESYLTLMGCYPIGTADKRMMIVAKKIPNP